MNAADLVRRLHQHRAWVNRLLLQAAAPLAEERLHARFAIGQGSIWKSLLHLYAGEFVWLAALLGNDDALAPGDARGLLPGNQQGESPIASLHELKQNWANLNAQWDNYLARLTPEALEEIVYRTGSISGIRSGTRRIDVLLHVCTHAHYTVAQVINMLRQNGIEKLPDPMLITFAREEMRDI